MRARTVYKLHPCTKRVAPDCEGMTPTSQFQPYGTACPACRKYLARLYSRKWRAGNGKDYERRVRAERRATQGRVARTPRRTCSCCGRNQVYRSRDGLVEFTMLCLDCWKTGEDRMERY